MDTARRAGMTGLPTLRQLEYIVAVDDHRHFGRAAAACGVSQPALSKQIKEVESALGAPIFERIRPGVLLTAVGQTFVPRARQLLIDGREMVLAAQTEVGRSAGAITLGVIPTVAPYIVPALLRRWSTERPDLSVVLREDLTDALLRDLAAGRVDLVLLALPVAAEPFDGVDVFEEPFVLAAPYGHPLDVDAAVHSDAIAPHALMLMEDGHCFRDHALRFCAAAGAGEHPTIRAASLGTLTMMVVAGLAATLVPVTALAKEFGPKPALCLRAFEGPQPSRRIGFRWRRGTARVQLFEQLANDLGALLPELLAGVPPVAGPPLELLRT